MPHATYNTPGGGSPAPKLVTRQLRNGAEVRRGGTDRRRLGPAQRLDQQLPEHGVLVGVERLKHVSLDGLLGAGRPLEGLPPLRGDEDAVAPAVLHITTADQMAGVLELVE